MSTLLMRLSSPLQAWGLDDKFDRRGTMREPTKSGVVGLLAAALGRGRDEEVGDLSRLRFGVRIDQPGQLLRDFHTARHSEGKPPYVSERYYLADAVFLAGVEGDAAFMRELDDALRSPAFPLYLGRRSCPPEGRVSLGVRGVPLERALREEPWQAGDWHRKRMLRQAGDLHRKRVEEPAQASAEPAQASAEPARLTLVVDAGQPGELRRRDMPLSFSQAHRRYAFRYVDDRVEAVIVGEEAISAAGAAEHDPFAELEG